jgi:nucleoside-diphosphate-sugar epimerase
MTTLVTGAFGCIGAWVCKLLLEAGEQTVAFDVGDDPWRLRMIVGPEMSSMPAPRDDAATTSSCPAFPSPWPRR